MTDPRHDSAHRITRQPREDLPLIGLALAHGACLLLWPHLLVIALGAWWNANTVSHRNIHRPFFGRRWARAGFSVYLSAVLGFPQELWRRRHLAHHAGRRVALRPDAQLVLDSVATLTLWACLCAFAPAFAFAVYAPAMVLAQVLCALHGYHEHAGGGTTSCHGRLYNLLFLNDGYHAEHHAHPRRDWRRLPEVELPAGARTSAWPPVLRWLDGAWLDVLERAALLSAPLQRWLVRRHSIAIRPLLEDLGEVRRVAIVGGGLFPRTAIVCRRLLPRAELVIIDGVERNLAIARRFLGDSVGYECAWFAPCQRREFDVVIVPLAYRGDRAALYRDPPAACVLVHDWIWRRRGEGATVSVLLGKRINRVRAPLRREGIIANPANAPVAADALVGAQ